MAGKFSCICCCSRRDGEVSSNSCQTDPVEKNDDHALPSASQGNPRNKVALLPGHSLMDWIRLGNSGSDLTSVGGRLLNVTEEELLRHHLQSNAWIAIRGKVYNVAPYLKFHPGGVDELMKGAGKDGTKLFTDVWYISAESSGDEISNETKRLSH